MIASIYSEISQTPLPLQKKERLLVCLGNNFLYLLLVDLKSHVELICLVLLFQLSGSKHHRALKGKFLQLGNGRGFDSDSYQTLFEISINNDALELKDVAYVHWLNEEDRVNRLQVGVEVAGVKSNAQKRELDSLSDEIAPKYFVINVFFLDMHDVVGLLVRFRHFDSALDCLSAFLLFVLLAY